MIACILGRQPELGLAEIESLYGADKVRLVCDGTVALVNVDQIGTELGGTVKVARVLTTVPGTSLTKHVRYIAQEIPKHLCCGMPEGKLKFGLSVFGLDTSTAEINRGTLFIKKSIKNAGRSVRIVPNNTPSLSSAQVIHNRLTDPLGMELLLIRDGNQTILAQTVHEQDIEAYGQRDHGRPKRDARVGMLPPKLAQIMIHLAEGRLNQPGDHTLLDPFCGTGVVLQEALLLGYNVAGTDINPRMVDYTRQNLDWLANKSSRRLPQIALLETGDATDYQWPPNVDLVVCEGYLGDPLTSVPDREKLENITHECNAIMRDFLKNIATQLRPGTPLCIAAPAWHTNSGVRHLPVLDDLGKIGYNCIDFRRTDASELIYHRPEQIVGRELVLLIKE